MDKINWLLKLSVLVGIAVGCNGSHPEQQKLQQLDSLQTEVEDFRLEIDSLNSSKISSLATHVDTQYEYVLNNYPDSADREFWLGEVAYFGQVRKALNRFKDNEKSLKKEIEYTEKQLKTLENSIRDEKLSEEKLEEYFNTEARAFQELSFQMGKSVNGAKRAITIWDSLGTRYDSIANHLRKLP